ncbi:uncharacterized protein [Amphiura filiformis]|uniref:uncharacterized protein isoform X2 n=1 Tax=Amphiura filiformis TaxID=82378 RepID=UPI003B217167
MMMQEKAEIMQTSTTMNACELPGLLANTSKQSEKDQGNCTSTITSDKNKDRINKSNWHLKTLICKYCTRYFHCADRYRRHLRNHVKKYQRRHSHRMATPEGTSKVCMNEKGNKPSPKSEQQIKRSPKKLICALCKKLAGQKPRRHFMTMHDIYDQAEIESIYKKSCKLSGQPVRRTRCDSLRTSNSYQRRCKTCPYCGKLTKRMAEHIKASHKDYDANVLKRVDMRVNANKTRSAKTARRRVETNLQHGDSSDDSIGSPSKLLNFLGSSPKLVNVTADQADTGKGSTGNDSWCPVCNKYHNDVIDNYKCQIAHLQDAIKDEEKKQADPRGTYLFRGSKRLASYTHPDRECAFVCQAAGCKRTKEHGRVFHITNWTEGEKEWLKSKHNLSADCCLCQRCRHSFKVQYKNRDKVSALGTEEGPTPPAVCYISKFTECREVSCIHSGADGLNWESFCAIFDIVDAEEQDIPGELPLCRKHYRDYFNRTQSRCEACNRLARRTGDRSDGLTSFANVDTFNIYLEKQGESKRLTSGSRLCRTCGNFNRSILRSQVITKANSDFVIRNKLQQIMKKKENVCAATQDEDLVKFANATAVKFTCSKLLNNAPFLFSEVKAIHKQAFLSQQNADIKVYRPNGVQLLQHLRSEIGNDLMCRHTSNKQCTMLYRMGLNLADVLHDKIIKTGT